MEMQCNKVLELIQNGVLDPPMDGNHGEKHPKTDDYVSIGVPFILVPDLKDGIVDLDNCNFISEEQAKNLKKGFSKTGDVLFTHKATIGKVALVDTKQYNYIILTPQVTYYRVKNDNILSNRYLYYYFLSPTFQKIFRAFASSGGTRDYLGIEAQRKLPIFYPEIHKQERIADILSQYDNLIHNNNKRIKILEQMAENLYKEWFAYEKIKDISKEVRLKEIISIIRGISYTTEEIETEEGTNLVNLKNIQAYGGFRRDGLKLYAGKYKKEQIVSCGDLIMGVTDMTQDRRTVGYVALVPQVEGISVISADLIRISSPIPNVFLYATFKYGNVSKYISQFANGANVLHLKPQAILGIKILLPQQTLIDKYVNIASKFFNEIEYLSQMNCNLTKQRDMLLPRLMSGKLEVK